MCFVAAGFHGRMRTYSIVSLVASPVTDMVAFAAATGPNLVLGIGERISIGAFLLWAAVLAVALWKWAAADRTTHVWARRFWLQLVRILLTETGPKSLT
jgi:hypothetical protein